MKRKARRNLKYKTNTMNLGKIIKISSFATVFLVVGFLFTSQTQAIEFYDTSISEPAYLFPATFELGTRSAITLAGQFKAPTWIPACPFEPVYMHMPRAIVESDPSFGGGHLFKYQLIDNTGTNPPIYQANLYNLGGPSVGDYYKQTGGDVLIFCPTNFATGNPDDPDGNGPPPGPWKPNIYRFNDVQIDVSGITQPGFYEVDFTSVEKVEWTNWNFGRGPEPLDANGCPDDYFDPDQLNSPAPCDTFVLDGSGTWGPSIVFLVTAPSTGTINVTSNLSTDWLVSGPQSFPGYSSTSASYSATPGNYSISASDIPCYNKSYNQTPQNLSAGGTITFAITYTDNGSCAPPTCVYSISPTSASVGSGGGTGSVSLTTDPSCTWIAVSNNGFITITAGFSGTGNGTVNYSVSANAGAARVGTMTIGGQTFTVNQAGAAAGSGSISASPNPCTVISPATTCSSTITWSTSGLPQTAEVWVSQDGAAETFFACGLSGNTAANFIQAASSYSFRLYPATDCGNPPAVKGSLLNSVTVTAISPSSINFAITYTPKALNPPTGVTVDNSVCGKITVNWQYTSNGVEDGFIVYRSLSGNPGTWSAITPTPTTPGYVNAAARSYQDTPPAVNTRYYYMVRTHRAAAINPTESTDSNSANAVNQACLANLSPSVKGLIRVNGAAYNSTVPIKAGDTLTYEIIIVNLGPSSAAINYICDNPSPTLTNVRNVAVTGPGAVLGAPDVIQNDATCIANGYSGLRLNISGTKDVANNWSITFDGTYTPTSSIPDTQEPINNLGVIYYTDGTGQHPKIVIAPTILVSTSKAQVPTFREVAP